MTSADRNDDEISAGARLPEFQLIDRLFAARSSARADVNQGIGDDAALTRPPAEGLLVTATDSLVSGTHFLPEQPAASVGHRALASNLSDLAAMGAQPLWASLALHLPDIDDVWLTGFAEGFFALAKRFDVELIGGDTVSGPLAVTVTLQGTVPETSALLRSGASAGEYLFVSGNPGGAAAGRSMQAGADSGLGRAFLFPEPRVELGKALRGVATSMIDISDGLHADLGQLVYASDVGVVAEIDQLPLGPLLAQGLSQEDAVGFALSGGEDYELLFSVPAQLAARVDELAGKLGCPLTQIGELTNGAGVEWRYNGAEYPDPVKLFRHF